MRLRGARRALALGCALAVAAPGALRAQQVEPPAPSRADSLLALGRLAAAEDELYRAASAKPRAPEPRGALGMYLASRARWRIAEILFEEAERFGADPRATARAKAMMAPYRARVSDGPVVALPLRPSSEPTVMAVFDVRPSRAQDGAVDAALDLRVEGLVFGRTAAERFGVRRGGVVTIWLGERRLEVTTVRVDSLAAPMSLRIGLDVLWPLHPQVDERAQVLTLGRAPNPAAVQGRTEQVPFVLTFPGLQLVPRVGAPPIALESRAGRAYLRGSRWQVDAATATLLVER